MSLEQIRQFLEASDDIHFQGKEPAAIYAWVARTLRPHPQGQPGYLRVDTMHQGDRDGVKGVYHINAVDEVTQWQVVGATAAISEAWLAPVLESILKQFPFRVRGFHSDNGSEFLNHTVEKLLNKLLIEQTKLRPRHSNDNGLVESENGGRDSQDAVRSQFGATSFRPFRTLLGLGFRSGVSLRSTPGLPGTASRLEEFRDAGQALDGEAAKIVPLRPASAYLTQSKGNLWRFSSRAQSLFYTKKGGHLPPDSYA